VLRRRWKLRVERAGLSAGLAGGVVAAFAATVFMALLLLVPGRGARIARDPAAGGEVVSSSGDGLRLP
jgi:hypothetical protein